VVEGRGSGVREGKREEESRCQKTGEVKEIGKKNGEKTENMLDRV